VNIKIRPGSRASIAAALQKLDDYEAMREREMTTFLDRLRQVGQAEATKRFAEAQYDGTNDVVVTAERTERGWRIIAQGEAVAFIEFGSGVFQPPYPSDALVQHERGVYGRGQGANENGWIYEGEGGIGAIPVRDRNGVEKDGVWRTWGNPPAMAMYYAVRAMRDAAPRIAKEVFGS
jgi:hypothetical protein